MGKKVVKKNVIIPWKHFTISKNTRIFFFTSLAVLLMLILSGYILLLDKNNSNNASRVNQMSSLVSKVRSLEENIQTTQDDILSLVKEYRDKTGKTLPTLDVINLSDEERLLLEEKINAETSISIKNLLAEILEKKSEILELNMHIKKIETYLPKPHIVSEGENHYQIAMDYLLNMKGVEKESALSLVERTLLFEPLVPGFKIWNFYSNGEFGSFVSQGSASISPNEVNRHEKWKLTNARDIAIDERDILARDIEVLKKKRKLIIKQINLLNDEKKNLMYRIEELNKENIYMMEMINSVHYLVDTKNNLIKGGVLKGGFFRSLKLQAVSPELFARNLDLRKRNYINIDLGNQNISKFKKLTVYPKFYKKDIDYKYSYNNLSNSVKLTFLSKSRLKNERIVISIE